MKITPFGSVYIVLVWGLIFIILGTALFIGYHRNISDLTQLMESEARVLIDIVSVSAQSGIHALDEIEDLTAEKLLNIAHLIVRLSEKSTPLPDTLTAIVRENDLHMINILDKNGVSVSRSKAFGETYHPARTNHRSEVESVLSGIANEAIIGFMDGRYFSDKRYGVVVRRPSGGAVVVNTNSEKMLAFRKTVGMGNLFQEFGERAGVQYIVLQDTLGIIAASRGVTEMTRILDDPFLMRAIERECSSRILNNGTTVFEVVHPFIVDQVNLGLIRIGLSTGTFEDIRNRAARQFLILFIAAMVSGALVIAYVILRQNYRLLASEHDRIMMDVRRMEEESRRTERLTSMGRLAAGVAHEIRNPLNAISIIVQRLKNECKTTGDEKEFHGLLSTVVKETSRIGAIIENFLTYARPPALQFSFSEVETLINDVINIVREKARMKTITISTDVQPNVTIWCDPEQLKQALLNIVLNAIEAVPVNGTITISASLNKEVAISVRDSGPGIPDDSISKIFDPYFTTRDEGTGLGLAEVHRIVTAHSGRIVAENDKEGGAVFTIFLPRKRK